MNKDLFPKTKQRKIKAIVSHSKQKSLAKSKEALFDKLNFKFINAQSKLRSSNIKQSISRDSDWNMGEIKYKFTDWKLPIIMDDEKNYNMKSINLPDIRSTPDPESNLLTKISSVNNLWTTQNTSLSKYRQNLYTKLSTSTKSILRKINFTVESSSQGNWRANKYREEVKNLLQKKLEKEGENYN